jgi:diguanylate cyclase (GGDEF)-like protein
MNFQAILIANITGFILISFLYISRFITRTKSDTEEHAFNAMVILALIACVIEPLTFAVDGVPGAAAKWTNLLGNTYLYYANGVGSYLFCMYVDLSLFHDRSRLKSIYHKLAYPVGFLLLTLFANIPFGYYFYVDANNVYHRQPSIYIFYVYLMLCALYSLGLYLSCKREKGEVAFFPIYMYLVPVVVACVLQMLFYGISLAWLGTAIGVVALYMSLQNQKTYKDSLTGLYNRLYLEHVVYIMNSSEDNYYGIMMDMDHFKDINDTYGHSVGDQALRDVATLMNRPFENRCRCFRYAGDEFIILAKTDSEDGIRRIEEQLLERTVAFNESGERPYQLSFSMGHAKFAKGEDNEDSFLKKIDLAMYECKRHRHERESEKRV